MSFRNKLAFFGGSDEGYQIARSLRFNDDDIAYLTNTSVAATDNKKWTISLWVKRANLGLGMTMFGRYAGAGTTHALEFNSSDQLEFANGATIWRASNAKFRDPTAWLHIVAIWDSANATADDRIKLYVNGSQITSFATNNALTINTVSPLNDVSNVRYLGTYNASSFMFDGYMAEVNFVDGQALLPTSFGEVHADTGAWNPKKYLGSYGINGYYLDFVDNSNTTSGTLGKDRSGNNNDWTPTNFSVAAGIGNDSLTDTPTNYADSEIHGNFCTLSPINKHAGGAFLLSNGNLQARGSAAANHYHAIGTFQIPEGKYYFEMVADADTFGASGTGIGVCDATFATAGNLTGDLANTSANVWLYLQDGNKRNNNSSTAFGATYTTNDVIGVAVDATNPASVKVWWSKNGTWQASGDPDAGTNAAYTITTGPVWPILKTVSCATGQFLNFGQRPFSYTANVTTFKALCTHNFSIPTILNPKKYVHVGNRTGTGAAGSRTGIPFQPNYIQNKPRNAGGNQVNPMTTSIRGTGKYRSTYTNGEVTDAQAITAFNSDGYSFGTAAVLNTNATAYWDFAMKSDPANGFEIITWTGDGAATKAITHNLGKKPGMCFAFTLGAGATLPYLWFKGFASDAHYMKDASGYMAAEINTNSPFSAFGTSTITVTNNATNNLNANAVEHMAILFTDGPLWAGGLLTGNSSLNGPVIYSGFKPAVIAFYTSTRQTWSSISGPDDYNGSTTQKENPLWATYGAQASSAAHFDILSNGAKLRNTGFTAANCKYWMAFAEQAGKYSRAV